MTQRSCRDAVIDFASSGSRVPILLIAIALSLRLAVAFWLPPSVIWEDGHRYERVADHILAGQGFGTLHDNALSVPTQPVLIALVKSIFGDNYLALRIFFSIIGAGTCLVGYLLGKRLFGPVAGMLAGLGFALYPHYLYLSPLFEYPQTFYIFINATAFLCLYIFFESRTWTSLAASGICFGLSILSVPTALLFVPFIIVSLWSRHFSTWLKYAAIMSVAISIPVGIWAVRNYSAYGMPILVNKAAGVNFWIANNESYYQFGKKAVVPFCGPDNRDLQFCHDFQAIYAKIADDNLSDKDSVIASEQASWKLGMGFVRTHPDHFIALMPRKFLQFWSPDPDAVSDGAERFGASRILIARLSYLPILLLGIVGLCMAITKRVGHVLPIVGYFLAMMLPFCVFLPTTRYRLPLDFFLILFTAYAIALLASVHVPPRRAAA
jgi:4-amino-4-deoxy-L-arabinose transferase-like glycosyltransferase